MTITEAISIWEDVLTGATDRMDPKFIESIKLFGRTVSCKEQEPVSTVFIRAGLCSSRGDFKRSIQALRLDEQAIVKDETIGGRQLLRKGKNNFVVAVYDRAI